MFDYEADQTGFSAPVFLLQLIGVPLGVLVLGLVFSIFLEALVGVKNSDLIPYFCYSVEGFLTGYVFQTSVPRACQSGGGWVWTVPVGLLAWGLIDELFSSPATAMRDFFVASAPDPSSAIIMPLLTLPALGSCFYSLGVFIASRPELSPSIFTFFDRVQSAG